MPSCVPFGGGVPKERAPARYGPSASSTRPSGGCSVSYSYWPRSSSSIPAARCSGSSQVLEYTRQLPAASAHARRMISASASRPAAAQRRLRSDFAVHAVTDADADGVQSVEHVELGDAQARDARVHDRATQGHGVEPAAAPPPPGDRAELVTDARQVLAVFVEQLGREGARAHAGGVGLDDAEHAVELPGTQARAGAGKARRGVQIGRAHV